MSRWSSHLLASQDVERTPYAATKAKRGIRVVTARGISVPARTVVTPLGVEILPVTAIQMRRFS